MSKLFSSVKGLRPNSNSFNLSHEKKLSLNQSMLTPILCQEVIPGDRFKLTTEVFARLAPMLAPVMHRVSIYTHFFFVPNRIVWDNWEAFITGGKNGDQFPAFPTIPMSTANQAYFKPGQLSDYLGIPPFTGTTVTGTPANISALPFRAYQLIYNEFFRDQNLSDPVPFSLGSVVAADYPNLLTLRNRCWEKDYFTSALPWTQRGTPVEIVSGGTNVVWTDNGAGNEGQWRDVNGTKLTSGTVAAASGPGTTVGSPTRGSYDPNGTLRTEAAAGFTVNDLRRSIRLQEWLERNARGGARYIEQILSHFGVLSSDARLQRPEYLGGGKTPITISEVLQTSSTDATTPQGNMSGHGISYGTQNGFSRRFEEHGYIIGLISILPRSGYHQGIPRHFSKSDRFDYFWPEFAHLGEQAVVNKELFYNGASPGITYSGTFGYQSRYAEYKFNYNTIAGDFRNTLNFWHMDRVFANQPNLNASFVQAEPINRIFAVTDPSVHHYYLQLYHSLRAIRLMPRFGTPKL